MVKESSHSGAGAGDIYKPIWFAYNFMDSFLAEGYTCRKTTNTETENLTESIVSAEEEVQDLTEDINANDGSLSMISTATPQTTPTPSSRRRKNPNELQDAGLYIKQAVSALNLALTKKDTREDECDLYGKMIASKLRKLPETERLQLMYDIDGMFLRQRWESLNKRNETQNIPFYSPSPSSNSYHSETSQPHSLISYNSEPIPNSSQYTSCTEIPSMHHGTLEKRRRLASAGSKPESPRIIIHSNNMVRSSPSQEVQLEQFDKESRLSQRSEDILAEAYLNT